MARIFISYRRADSQANTDRIYSDLRRVFGRRAIFKDVDDIPPGADFPTYLADKIQDAQVVLVIIGRTWSTIADQNGNRRLDDPRDFVRVEVEAALKLKNARIIPILVNDASMPASGNLPESLRFITQLNAMSVRNDPDFYNDSRRLVRKLRELGIKRVGFSGLQMAVFAVAFASVIFAIMTLLSIINNGGGTGDTTPTDAQAIIAQGDTETPTLSGTEREMTVQAEILQIQTEAAQTVQANQTATPAMATAFAQMTIYAQATTDTQATQTATLWTPTPTPDARRTAEARLTLTRDAEIAQATQQARDLTATATLWTPNATATLIAFRPRSNDDWTPIERDFDGVTMVLVPAGCFMMGSEDGSDDEKPAHEQCFDAPFWIDKYEVTQTQFRQLGGTQVNSPGFAGDNRPVERITWLEARDFCELRGMRLPTEAEWEYAARGPDNLVYPWGNTWNTNNAVWNRSSSQGTANVGSIAAGVSWVGALDMSGNVREWVSSLYQGYPYSDDHESNSNTSSTRVLRGGSWVINAGVLRAAYRYGSYPDDGLNNVGFRCARSQ